MSFLVELRKKNVESQMNSATSIFTKAIRKFEKAITSAQVHIEKNKEEMQHHATEHDKRARANLDLHDNIAKMEKSIAKINHIVGE